MQRCKICRVPLSGILGKVEKFLFKVNCSEEDDQICNKCSDKSSSKNAGCGKDEKFSGEKYKCQICNRMIHQERALEHIKAEEYIINLIRKDHSHWQDEGATCLDCVEYYRKLVNKTEI